MSDLYSLLARLTNPPEGLPPDHLWPEGLHNEAAVALTELRTELAARTAECEALTKSNLELQSVLRLHHGWHAAIGTVKLGSNDTWAEVDLSLEYTDSTLCKRTLEALGNAIPDRTTELVTALEKAETMLREHAAWTDGVDRVGAGHQEDIVIVSLPNHVRIIDTADDCRDALASWRGDGAQ